MHRNSELLWTKYAAGYITSGASVLEISPEAQPSAYSRLCHSECQWQYLHVGYEHSEYEYRISDEAHDVVISGQVAEHVPCLWLWLPELARICRRGGRVITIAPVSWPYHPAPVDCWRIYPDGMAALYEHSGLSVNLCVAESLDGQHTDTIAIGTRF